MLLLYKILSLIALASYAPFLLFKKGPEDKQAFITERLGMSSYEKTDIWVHAVSVGETLACLPFVKKLRTEFPGKKITFSTTTYTGQKLARERFPEAERIMYMPLDTVPCISRAVSLLRPDIFITVETELWPLLFQSLKDHGARIVILNGRISRHSFKGYSRIKFLLKKMLDNVDFFYMQTQDDADRILSLGADREKTAVMGNFKFDFQMNESSAPEWLNSVTGRILLAASTHRGEDGPVLDAYTALRNRFHDLKLIIAPRHPERFNEVAELIEKKGFNYVRRSEISQESGVGSQKSGVDSNYDIVLLDTIGELSGVFAKATVAFIGGSLVPIGGHNILEPACWSKPVIFGPYMENFPVAAEFIEKSAALQVENSADITEKVSMLLEHEETALSMGRNARAIFDRNTGAVQKAIELIRGYIGTAQ